MPSQPRCHQFLLAERGALKVTRCTCGHVHLTIGPVTMRVEADTLPVLCDLFVEASSRHEALATPGPAGLRH